MKLQTKELEGQLLNWAATSARFKWLKEHKDLLLKPWVEEQLNNGDYVDRFSECDSLAIETVELLKVNLGYRKTQKRWTASVKHGSGAKITQESEDIRLALARIWVSVVFGDEMEIAGSVLDRLNAQELA